MKNQAFTLIELLVVVLIIGILAAIAVPQYQKAVGKSRYNTIKGLVNSIKQAQEIYYLANNKYADDFAELDIVMPADKIEEKSSPNKYVYSWGHCRFSATQAIGQIKIFGASMQYQNYIDRNRRTCVSFNTDMSSIQNQICMEETGDIQTSCNKISSGYCSYSYK